MLKKAVVTSVRYAALSQITNSNEPRRVCCSSLLIEAPVLRCWQHATFPKRSNQNGVVTVPFHAVAGPAEQLQILEVIGAAMTLRHDVIHGEVPKRKRDTAAAATSLLFSEERVPVRPVVR